MFRERRGASAALPRGAARGARIPASIAGVARRIRSRAAAARHAAGIAVVADVHHERQLQGAASARREAQGDAVLRACG